MEPGLQELTAALHKAWSAETSYAGDQWPADNPARGQCVTSSLVVQDYYGGRLIRFAVKGEGIQEYHYCNVLGDGTLLDTTRSQYKTTVTMQEKPVDLAGFQTLRQKRLADGETRQRYQLLKARVQQYLHS